MASPRIYSTSDLDLIEQSMILQARRSFWAYRQYMNPKMKKGWWQKEVATELQCFIDDFMAGMKPMLVIQAPPQHGKSFQIIDLISWLAGHNPDCKAIYTAFSERLGIRANLRLQRIYDSAKYQNVFPETRINHNNTVTVSGQYLRNREILEYVDREGGFRNTTVRGAITGEGLDLGIIDDPMKGREDANSERIRDKTWEWFTDDFFTRFSEDAAFLSILTRWHIDDPIGRLIEHYPQVRVLSYPAIAVKDETHRKKGEPLFPEHKSLEFLERRRAIMSASSWESLYQQNPIIDAGSMFKVDQFKIVSAPPAKIMHTVRFWDKAGTEGDGAYTAGVKVSRLKDGSFYIHDTVRGQWSAANRERKIKQTAETDGFKTHIWVEQEPGSGGKESADNTIKNLAGYVCRKDKVTGSKETRADPYAVQVEIGNVYMERGDWNREFIEEHRQFPNGKYKDQVDAAAGAFSKVNIIGLDWEALTTL